MNTFEDQLRAALVHRVAGPTPRLPNHERVRARAAALRHRRQAGAAGTALGIAGLVGMSGLPELDERGADPTRVLSSGTASAAPVESATPGASAGPEAPTPSPSSVVVVPTLRPSAEERTPSPPPSPLRYAEDDPENPFAPVDPADLNGPAEPTVTIERVEAPEGADPDLVWFRVRGHDPDGHVAVNIAWGGRVADEDSRGDQGFVCDGSRRAEAYFGARYLTPGTYTVTATVQSSDCEIAPDSEHQFAEVDTQVQV